MLERIIDLAARELRLDPAELRRRNAIRRDELPYRTPLGIEIDSGDFPAVLDQTLRLGDRAGFAGRAAAAKARGRRRGQGLALYLECTGGAPQEYAELRFNAAGYVDLAVGSHSTGMGHETVMAQLVASKLGLPLEHIRFHQADTALTPQGGGHGGSRSVEVGGAAILLAVDKVIERAKTVAADLLEAAVADVQFTPGLITIAGTDRSVSLAKVIQAACESVGAGCPSALDDSAVFTRERISYPNGCHLAEVEVDPSTGEVALLNYAIVDDFGTIINPLLADGQVIGGTAQGIGQALLEQAVYSADGQLVTGSLMDYSLPRAADVPPLQVAYYEDAPTRHNPLGVKGAGEAGCVGAPPAVVNAVVNALADFNVRHIDMPLTPERVWRAIQSAAGAPDKF